MLLNCNVELTNQMHIEIKPGNCKTKLRELFGAKAK